MKKVFKIFRWPFRSRSRSSNGNGKKTKKTRVYAYRSVHTIKDSHPSRPPLPRSYSDQGPVGSWPLPPRADSNSDAAQLRYQGALGLAGMGLNDAAITQSMQAAWSAELRRRRNSSPADYPITPPRTDRQSSGGDASYLPQVASPDAISPTNVTSEVFSDTDSLVHIPTQSNEGYTGPSYNVTVHRKKIHALAHFPASSVDSDSDSNYSTEGSQHSTRSAGEGRGDTRGPHSNRTRHPALEDNRYIQSLVNDPAIYNVLRLYDNLGHIPSTVFSNTPNVIDTSPQLSTTPLSEEIASEINEVSMSTISQYPPSTTRLEAEQSSIEALDEGPESDAVIEISSKSPFVQRPESSLVSNNDGIGQIPTEELRLSSPLLLDILFSPFNNKNNTNSPATDANPSLMTPALTIESEVLPRPFILTESPAFPQSLEARPSPGIDESIDENKENEPPFPIDGLVSNGAVFRGKDVVNLNDAVPESPQMATIPLPSMEEEGAQDWLPRSHDSAFYSLYSSSSSNQLSGSQVGSSQNGEQGDASSSFAALEGAVSSKHSNARTSPSPSSENARIVDYYADMTNGLTDSEEENIVANAILQTWETAKLKTFTSSPEASSYGTPAMGSPDVTTMGTMTTSPASTVTPALGMRGAGSPWSPASTFELPTPTNGSPTMGGGRAKVGVGAGSPAIGLGLTMLKEEEAPDQNVLSDADQSFEWRAVDELNVHPDPLNYSLEAIRLSPRSDRRRLLRSYHAETNVVRVSPRTSPNRLSIGTRNLASNTAVAQPSPHRGIVGLDGGSNREAFLYGTLNDEAFSRKLNSRLAPFRVSSGKENVSAKGSVRSGEDSDSAASAKERRAASPLKSTSPARPTLGEKVGLGTSPTRPLREDVFGVVVPTPVPGAHHAPTHNLNRIRSHSRSHSTPSLPISAPEPLEAPYLTPSNISKNLPRNPITRTTIASSPSKSFVSRIPRLQRNPSPQASPKLGSEGGTSSPVLRANTEIGSGRKAGDEPRLNTIRGVGRRLPLPRPGPSSLRAGDSMSFGAGISSRATPRI